MRNSLTNCKLLLGHVRTGAIQKADFRVAALHNIQVCICVCLAANELQCAIGCMFGSQIQDMLGAVIKLISERCLTTKVCCLTVAI